MQRRITWLGIIFSVMVPALGILSRNGPKILPEQIPVIWAILSFFLLMIWFMNYVVYVRLLYRYRVRFGVGVLVIATCDTLLVLFFFILVQLGAFPFSSDQYSLTDYSLLIRFGFGISLVAVIQYMFISVEQGGRLKRKNEQLRIENLVAELEGLKQQINPHFLFNSLATLRAMIHEKDENAEQFVLRLAAVYRQFLSKRNETKTTLSEELAFLENYMYMLRFRYEGRFLLSIDVEEVHESRKVPVFCLQLLIENCIKHNVLSQSKPLKIRIYQKSQGTITVENNKQPKKTDVESLGIGLDNLRKRYTLLGQPDAVGVSETDDYFAVTLTLLGS